MGPVLQETKGHLLAARVIPAPSANDALAQQKKLDVRVNQPVYHAQSLPQSLLVAGKSKPYTQTN